ncbi:hypothetical protein Q0Z83_036590 [Actinoplanes sichuanensis]|uniref:DUF6069 family protein n=1 Tax=Actinoplanes sichuanensis TaxID=512349 RepID=A0ABW4ARD1_9ACTN|nr:DUF6069 family protein [Actinoplanes sichuanensis]BEL05468.1 hypothetical protein Q0Z83_036590 [Actinoplanes sichuanensis]
MRTLTLPGGARVAVDTEHWHDVFAVVDRGRVQLESRTGEPGPVLDRDAGFWLRGTGVRALRNPGRRTARIRLITRNPNSGGTTMSDTLTRPTHRILGFVGRGLPAALAATVITTIAAAVVRAAGVTFEVPAGGETIPLPGFATVTGFFSLVGVVIAAALLRWSARPAERFRWTAVALTVVSLVPPFLVGAAAATIAALVGLHLVAAAVMIPLLVRGLRASAPARR